MRMRYPIIVFLVAGVLAGCESMRERSPWRKKDVPITPPSEVSPHPIAPAPQATAPAEQPLQAPAPPVAVVEIPSASSDRFAHRIVEAPKPVEPVETQMPEGEAEPGPVYSPPADEPASDQPPLPPVRLEKPIPLEDLPFHTPTAEPEIVETRPAAPQPPAPAVEPPKAEEPLKIDPALQPSMSERIVEDQPTPPVRPVPVDQPAPAKSDEVRPTTVAIPAPQPAPAEAAPPHPLLASPPHRIRSPRYLPAPAPVVYGKEEVVAASLVQVNDEFFTIEDVLRAARDDLAALPRGIGERAFRQQAMRIMSERLRNLVIESLVYNEAQLRITDEQKQLVEKQLDKTLRELIAEVGGSRTKLEEEFARRGTDIDTVMNEERRRLLTRGFLHGRFAPAISITRKMLWDYYRKNREEFSSPKKVQMQIIAAPFDGFPASPGRPSSSERRLAEARARAVIGDAADALRAGESFEQVARQFSRGIKAKQGGIWPMMPAGSFRAEALERKAFSLDAGQVSGIVGTDTGFYIVKARQIQPGRIGSFEEAQEQIDSRLRDRQFGQLQKNYFRRLLRKAQIHQAEQFLEYAADRAATLYRQD